MKNQQKHSITEQPHEKLLGEAVPTGLATVRGPAWGYARNINSLSTQCNGRNHHELKAQKHEGTVLPNKTMSWKCKSVGPFARRILYIHNSTDKNLIQKCGHKSMAAYTGKMDYHRSNVAQFSRHSIVLHLHWCLGIPHPLKSITWSILVNHIQQLLSHDLTVKHISL